MSLASRLGLLALVAGGCLAVYEWDLVANHPREITQAALRQFDNSDAAATELRVADSAKHWWVLGGIAGLVLLSALLCWDDVERWWKKSESLTTDGTEL